AGAEQLDELEVDLLGDLGERLVGPGGVPEADQRHERQHERDGEESLHGCYLVWCPAFFPPLPEAGRGAGGGGVLRSQTAPPPPPRSGGEGRNRAYFSVTPVSVSSA